MNVEWHDNISLEAITKILIATDAVQNGEGINLQFCRLLIKSNLCPGIRIGWNSGWEGFTGMVKKRGCSRIQYGGTKYQRRSGIRAIVN